MDIANMVDMLPHSDQVLVHDLVHKLVLAWDPDFTKMTPEERARIEQAEAEFARGETCTRDELFGDGND